MGLGHLATLLGSGGEVARRMSMQRLPKDRRRLSHVPKPLWHGEEGLHSGSVVANVIGVYRSHPQAGVDMDEFTLGAVFGALMLALELSATSIVPLPLAPVCVVVLVLLLHKRR